MDTSDRLIVALDTPDAEEAVSIADRLSGAVARVKVGLTLFSSAGPDIVMRLADSGFGIFLDLKLHDIPHQVAGACGTLTRLGVDMFTIHASGGRDMMLAAVEATRETAERVGVSAPAVLAVTVLTSVDDERLAEIGVECGAEAQVVRLAALAAECGVDGVVCSPMEAGVVRKIMGPQGLVVTPGVRPMWAQKGDQARVATPADAIASGASHLVVGRPVTMADDPADAVRRIVREM